MSLAKSALDAGAALDATPDGDDFLQPPSSVTNDNKIQKRINM